MKIAIYIALTLLTTTSLFAQNQIEVAGKLFASLDSTPIPRAHILNITAGRGVLSEEDGSFSILTNANDSILVSVIGYYNYTDKAFNIGDTIYLKERNYVLELYNVMPYKTFEEFKYAFINLELRDTIIPINPRIALTDEELVGLGHRGTGIIVSGLISGILGMFNKRMKDYANYLDLLERDKYETYLATKFNPKLVERITELNDSKKLYDFINYCDFTNSYIDTNSYYTIITQTFECYEEYLNLPLANTNNK